jgi:hypothetical protein
MDFQFYSLDLHAYPYASTTQIDYYIFVAGFEMVKCESLQLCPFPRLFWLFQVPCTSI